MVEWENGNYDALPATSAEKEFPIFQGIDDTIFTDLVLFFG
jgi:hypothetical protein